MKGKDLLGSFSPVYGLSTGHGAFGKLADSGLGGLIPTALAQERKEEENKAGAMKKGGVVKKMAKGGSVKSASKRADGCAMRGKTRGKMV